MQINMDRPINTTLFNILDLIACAYDYGHHNQIIMGALFDMAGQVTDEEIDAFAQAKYLSEQATSQGYGQEDADRAIENIKAFREMYGKVIQ